MSSYIQDEHDHSSSPDKLEQDAEKGGQIDLGELKGIVTFCTVALSISILAEVEALALPYFDDPNIDRDAAITGILEDDSPYPEVRSAVANTDDPDIPVSTIRSWVLGAIWAIIIAGLNQFFFFRYPSVNVTPVSTRLA